MPRTFDESHFVGERWVDPETYVQLWRRYDEAIVPMKSVVRYIVAQISDSSIAVYQRVTNETAATNANDELDGAIACDSSVANIPKFSKSQMQLIALRALAWLAVVELIPVRMSQEAKDNDNNERSGLQIPTIMEWMNGRLSVYEKNGEPHYRWWRYENLEDVGAGGTASSAAAVVRRRLNEDDARHHGSSARRRSTRVHRRRLASIVTQAMCSGDSNWTQSGACDKKHWLNRASRIAHATDDCFVLDPHVVVLSNFPNRPYTTGCLRSRLFEVKSSVDRAYALVRAERTATDLASYPNTLLTTDGGVHMTAANTSQTVLDILRTEQELGNDERSEEIMRRITNYHYDYALKTLNGLDGGSDVVNTSPTYVQDELNRTVPLPPHTSVASRPAPAILADASAAIRLATCDVCRVFGVSPRLFDSSLVSNGGSVARGASAIDESNQKTQMDMLRTWMDSVYTQLYNIAVENAFLSQRVREYNERGIWVDDAKSMTRLRRSMHATIVSVAKPTYTLEELGTMRDTEAIDQDEYVQYARQRGNMPPCPKRQRRADPREEEEEEEERT